MIGPMDGDVNDAGIAPGEINARRLSNGQHKGEKVSGVFKKRKKVFVGTTWRQLMERNQSHHESSRAGVDQDAVSVFSGSVTSSTSRNLFAWSSNKKRKEEDEESKMEDSLEGNSPASEKKRVPDTKQPVGLLRRGASVLRRWLSKPLSHQVPNNKNNSSHGGAGNGSVISEAHEDSAVDDLCLELASMRSGEPNSALVIDSPQEATSPNAAQPNLVVADPPAVPDAMGGGDSEHESGVSEGPTRMTSTRRWANKPSFVTLGDRAQRDFLNRTDVRTKLMSVVEQCLQEDNRPRDPESVAAVMQAAAAQASNAALHCRGFTKGATKMAELGGDHKLASVVTAPERASQTEAGVTGELLRSLQYVEKKSPDRRRILTALTVAMSRQDINVKLAHCDPNLLVSEHEYRVSKTSGLKNNAISLPSKKVAVRKRIRAQKAQDDANWLFAFELVRGFVHPLAYGTRMLPLNGGGAVEMAKCALTHDVGEIRVAYYAAVNDARTQFQRQRVAAVGENAMPDQHSTEEEQEEACIDKIPRAHLDLIIDAMSGGKNVNLAALDPIFLDCCLDNGKKLLFLITTITAQDLPLRATLTQLFHEVDLFLRHQYPDHLFPDSTVGMHSEKYAFSTTATSTSMYCEKCAQVELLFQSVEAAIRVAPLKSGEESQQELIEYLHNRIVHNYHTYIAHVVRKTYELQLEQMVLERRINHDGVLIRCDYKMKMLSLIARESMPMFYGKRGFSWCGMAFVRYKTAEELLQDPKGQVVVHFIDALADSAVENAFATNRIIEAGCCEYASNNPHIRYAVLLTDGAGCFSGNEFAYYVTNIHLRSGIYILEMLVLEPGCGKSYLDTHFAAAMAKLKRVVANGEGRRDIENARDCAKNLVELGGIGHCSSLCIELPFYESSGGEVENTEGDDSEEEEEGEEGEDAEDAEDRDEFEAGSTSKPIRVIIKGLKKYAHRRYVYSPEGSLVQLELFHISLHSETPNAVILQTQLQAVARANGWVEYPICPYESYQPSAEYISVNGQRVPRLVLTTHDRNLRLQGARARQELLQHGPPASAASPLATSLQTTSTTTLPPRSRLHMCHHPHCSAEYQSLGWLQRHFASKHGGTSAEDASDPPPLTAASPHGTITRDTDHDDIIHAVVERSVGTQFVSSLSSRSDYLRQEPPQLSNQNFADWKLLDGATPFNVLKCAPPAGFGLKGAYGNKRKGPPLSTKVIDFVLFLHLRGERVGTKTLPSQAEAAMWKCGTTEGAAIFNIDTIDRETMAVQPNEVRLFKLGELKSAQQLKALMKMSTAALTQKRAKAEAAEAKARLIAESPLFSAIVKIKPRARLLSLLHRVLSHHEPVEYAELAQDIAVYTLPTTKPEKMRWSLYNIISFMGNKELDMALFKL